MSVREFVPSDDGRGLRIRVVAAQWNDTYVRRLLDAALETLRARGVAEQDMLVQRVPGSFELPTAAHWAVTGAHAVIALGCVIRGDTAHFELVAQNCARGLMEVSLASGVPVVNGVLAVENAGQAEARSGGEVGNTGAQVALAAIRMANLAAGRAAS